MMRKRRTKTNKGASSVAAVGLLTILATLAAGMAAEAGTTLRKAQNEVFAQDARMETDSGIAYATWLLRQVRLRGNIAGQAMMDSLAASLQTRLNGTPNLAGQTVAYDGNQIVIPAVSTDGADRGFSAVITRDGDGTVRLAVVGARSTLARGARLDFQLTQGNTAEFNYGVASRGKVEMTGNARVLGANEAWEANILSATYSDSEAVKLVGNCTLDGDLYVSNPDAHVTMTGNMSIGGESQAGGNIDEHVHIGVGEVEFPEADPSVFEPFAINTLSGGTSGNKTFSNIRIPANTNPTFSGNITLNGVIFIETPNKVKFTGNLTVTGVIITEDAGENALAGNYLNFAGNTTVRGVEMLPDEPQYAGLKALPGTFLLAPGFSTSFAGNFGTVNGAMAAEEFKFAGNAGGVVRGPVICWGDYPFKLTGNSSLTIDRQGNHGLPPGFSASGTLAPLPRTYEEFVP